MPAPLGHHQISHRTESGKEHVHSSDVGSGDTLAYVLFTRILTTHVEFGGWAHWGYNAVSSVDVDGYGRRTAVASFVGGTAYGGAKAVKLAAVKTLDSNGSGATSRAVAGINWAVSAATANDGRSVLVGGFRGRYFAAVSAAFTTAHGARASVFISSIRTTISSPPSHSH